MRQGLHPKSVTFGMSWSPYHKVRGDAASRVITLDPKTEALSQHVAYVGGTALRWHPSPSRWLQQDDKLRLGNLLDETNPTSYGRGSEVSSTDLTDGSGLGKHLAGNLCSFSNHEARISCLALWGPTLLSSQRQNVAGPPSQGGALGSYSEVWGFALTSLCWWWKLNKATAFLFWNTKTKVLVCKTMQGT